MSVQARQLQSPAEQRDILLQFITEYLLEPPDDLIHFGLTFFGRLEEKRKKAMTDASIKLGTVTIDNQTVRSVKEETTPVKPVRTKPNPDQSVDNEDKSDRAKAPKTHETRTWLSDALTDTVFYRSLDDQQRGEVLDAMFEKSVHANECIIEEGDNLYVIASGVFNEYIRGSKEPICTYDNEGTFGARGLAYSVPKAPTVQAQQDGKLWVLKRSSYQRILLESTLRKRASFDSLLQAVPKLTTLQDRDRLALVDTAAVYAAVDRVKVAFLDVGAFERLLDNGSGGNESPLV